MQTCDAEITPDNRKRGVRNARQYASARLPLNQETSP
jgi:hypothetical protein